MFGSTSFSNQPTNTINTFGNFSAGPTTTTPSLFGQPQQQTTAMPLFGSTNTNTGFNTPMKQTTFGTSFGSTPSNVVTPLFGAAQPNRIAPTSTGIFSNQPTQIVPFAQGQAQGTSITFNPLGGTDTMMRNGQPSPISTRHQCITCMKEYENKSLEELRLEDYQLGRKGPQGQPPGLFGGAVSQQPPGLFGGMGNSTTSAFGQQRTTTFGTQGTSAGLFSNLNQQKPPSLFSSTNTGTTFGAPTFSFPTTTTQSGGGLLFNQNNNTTATTAAPFSFAAQPQTQMNLFNTKPLTAPATTTTTFAGFNSNLNKPLGIFSSTASAPFGTTNTLGTSTAPTSLFSQPAQAKTFQPFSFNTQPATQQTFGQQPPTSTFSFSTPTTTTASISFGSTPAPMFGSGTTGTSSFSFNPNPSTGISLGAPATTTTTFPSFSFQNQPQQPSTGFSFFNNSNTNTMQATNLQLTPQPTGPVPFATTPYKDSPLFYNVITNRSIEEMSKPTNPLAQRAVKEASRRRTSSYFSTSSSSPSTLGNLTFSANTSRSSSYNKQSSIFDGFDEDNSASAVDVLSPKTSIKKLSLKDLPQLNEVIQVPTLTPTLLKFNVSKNDSSSTPDGRHRFSGRNDYMNSNSVGENNSDLSPTTPNLQGSVIEEPGQENTSTPLSSKNTKESVRIQRNLRQRGNKSNVKCTRAGYYTEPTLEGLDALTDDEGHCCLEGFVVGRHNFGRIQFLEPVDVAGLNLDNLVHFRHKETVVYPDDNVKPPVGEGINVPAEISMVRIWPMDRATHEPIKSPAKVKSLNYEDKLRRSCKRMDAEFISYDPELGVWIFQVKHFSKYTCEPEENEDVQVEVQPPLKPRLEEKIGLGGVHFEEFRLPQPPPQGLTIKQQGLEKTSPEFHGKYEEFKSQSHPVGLTIKQGLDKSSTEYHGGSQYEEFKSPPHTPSLTVKQLLEKSSAEYLGGVQFEEFKPPPPHTPQTPSLTIKQGPEKSSTDFPILKRELKETSKSEFPGHPPFPKCRIMQSSFLVRKVIRRRQLPLVAVRRPLDMFDALSEESSCVPSRSSRGGRVGFGPNGHFVQILNTRSTKPNGFVGQVKLLQLQTYRPQQTFNVQGLNFERGDAEKHHFNAIKSVVRNQLKLQLESSELDGEGKFKSGPSGNVASHMDGLKDLRRKASRGGVNFSQQLEQEESMWRLCKILWPADQVEQQFSGKFDRRHCYYQRQALLQWLVSDGVGLFKDSTQDNSVNGLFRRGQKLKACQEAVEQDNCTLALCMAQNSYDCKETCDIQMLQWEINDAEEFLPDELKELYQLCSGCPIWNRINLRRMSTTDWLQHFAIYDWYLAPPYQSISQVVELYQQFITKAIRPVDCDTSDLSFPASSDEEATIANLCINLLKAYSCSGYPVTKLLAPGIRTRDLLDYKISWLLMNNVIRFGFDVNSDLFNTVSTSFAGQLEALGCFEWAVFVLQHCEPSEERTCLIKRILERNVYKTSDIKLEKFISSLGGNSTALWDAKIVAAVKKNMYTDYEHVWYLLKSGRYNEAYKVFLSKCRKNFLSPTKMSSTFSLLEEMASVAPHIHDWEGYGGALYNLLQAMKSVTTGAESLCGQPFPTLPQAVASFGKICPKDAVDFHLVMGMGFLIKYVLQTVVDHPPTDNLDFIGQIKVLQFPSVSPDMARFPRRLEEYFNKLRFNEEGIQLDACL